MEHPDTTPRNGPETLLLDLHSELIDPETFARRLLQSQIFLPVKDEKQPVIAGLQRSTQAEPLILRDAGGNKILVLFSAPDRARDLLAAFPGYGGGILVEFSWILRRMAGDLSISINPDQSPGFDLDPEMVAMVASLLPEEAQ
jgi:hypothetical protein